MNKKKAEVKVTSRFHIVVNSGKYFSFSRRLETPKSQQQFNRGTLTGPVVLHTKLGSTTMILE
jgi:hypothetical protein